MSAPGQVFGQQDVNSTTHEFNTLVFVFQMLLQKVQTATLVEVVSCTNDGGASPIGTVTVQPLVNQMTGNRTSVPHGELFNLLYCRYAGGQNAVIMDPQPGDIGLMAFCSRDISGVRANEGQADPGSFRMFDWADGIYAMGVPIGITPQQYIAFAAGGIDVVSPTKITLSAPTVEIDASTELKVQSPDSEFSGTIHTPGTITGDTQVVAGTGGSAVHLTTHTHPTAGTGPPSPPTPGT